jgi:hypothetical protein
MPWHAPLRNTVGNARRALLQPACGNVAFGYVAKSRSGKFLSHMNPMWVLRAPQDAAPF